MKLIKKYPNEYKYVNVDNDKNSNESNSDDESKFYVNEKNDERDNIIKKSPKKVNKGSS